MFSRTVFHGNKRKLLEDHGAVGTGFTDYLAADPHSAEDGHPGPATMRKSVVLLPQPEGPTTATKFSLANCPG